MPTKYEVRRQEIMSRNTKMLNGLKKEYAVEDARAPQPKQVGRKSAPNKLKKRMRRTSNDEIEGPRPTKRARPEISQSDLRRSLRNAGKETPDYQGESQVRLPRLVATKVGMDHDGDPRRPSGKRIHNPYA
jgi:hypothetical protein